MTGWPKYINRWSEERVVELRNLWDAGYSCGQIARIMGNGFSRSAVIGKASRLGLPAKQSGWPTRQARECPKPQLPAAPPPPPAPPALPTVQSKRIPLAHVGFCQCRFGVSEDGAREFLCCGLTTLIGESWCSEHRRTVFQPSASVRARNAQAPKDVAKSEAA